MDRNTAAGGSATDMRNPQKNRVSFRFLAGVGMNRANQYSIIAKTLLLSLAVAQCLMAAGAEPIDFADSAHVDDWYRHPVFGDPSFDSFERLPGNPIFRGTPPLEWPVNGFFFDDPISRHWYVYVGEYTTGYQARPSRCEALRSEDRGKSWKNLGKIFPDEPLLFDSDGKSPGHLPDVSVVYFDHRYHMVYDWGKQDQSDGGIAYALADHPEGPFRRASEPIQRQSRQEKLLGRYNRPYAATLLRRERDWLVLAMMDSAPFGWAMYAITATDPAGPWSRPVIVRHPEHDRFHPPLLEFFPAFATSVPTDPPVPASAVRQTVMYAYAPATSVASNRNFQCLFRAPLERAEDPAAWELFRHGSLWHAEDTENEFFGIWGQTFSGSVDANDRMFRVMFPCRDARGNGTINLAARPWPTPFREHGFVLSGHQGSSFTCLLKSSAAFRLQTQLRLRGTARLLWDYRAPLEPNHPTSDATLASSMLTRHQGLELSPDNWRVIAVDERGGTTSLAAGKRPPGAELDIGLNRMAAGRTSISLGDQMIWSTNAQPVGTENEDPGAICWLADPHSHLFVKSFVITPEAPGMRPAHVWLGAVEALLDAAQDPGNWQAIESPMFHFGHGLVSKTEASFAKWSFVGHSVALWSPRGPAYGTLSITLDGTPSAKIDLHADAAQSSTPLWKTEDLSGDFHGIVLRGDRAPIPIDCIDVTQ